MLACSTSILGVKHYTCANDHCHHVKYLCNTCHCRACPSCGKKATDQWIAVQNNRLPDCPWYHLVCTLPDVLWPLFFHNRGLLDALCRFAADNLLHAAQRRGVYIGLLDAIHTYGRRLNWHPHVHLSATAGGLDEHGAWKNMTFHEKAMRQRWMWNVREYLLKQWGQLTLPWEWTHITSESDWRNLILNAGGTHWHIYQSKKTANGRKPVNYLGRYLKKPPICGSRLAHYTSSATLSFTYLNHRTKTYQEETLSQADMLRRVVQHIPEKHFRMIRYLGLYVQTAEISVEPIKACFETGRRCANLRFCLVTTGYRRINDLPDAKTYCQIIWKGNRLLQSAATEISAVWAYNPSREYQPKCRHIVASLPLDQMGGYLQVGSFELRNG